MRAFDQHCFAPIRVSEAATLVDGGRGLRGCAIADDCLSGKDLFYERQRIHERGVHGAAMILTQMVMCLDDRSRAACGRAAMPY